MDAIQKGLKITKRNSRRRLVIWSIRYKCVDGQYVLGNARPCLYCKQVALRYGIHTVCYSDENGMIKKEKIENLESELTPASAMHLKHYYKHTHINIKRPHLSKKI